MATFDGSGAPGSTVGGVEEGKEVTVEDTEGWNRILPSRNTILECHLGSSSASVGGGDDWFAVLVSECAVGGPGDGLTVYGEMLGCEYQHEIGELVQINLSDGGAVHLCPADPCKEAGKDKKLVHVTKVKVWSFLNFKAEYLSEAGSKRLKAVVRAFKAARTRKERRDEEERLAAEEAARKREKRKEKKKEAKDSRKKGKSPQRTLDRGKKTRKEKKSKTPLIEVDSENEDGGSVEPESEYGNGEGEPDRARLMATLARAKERMLQGKGLGVRVRGDAVGQSGGVQLKSSQRVREERGLVAGTSLNPRMKTRLALADAPPAIRDTFTEHVKERRRSKRGATAQLLAQAEQQEMRQRSKQSRKSSSRKRVVQALGDLLTGRKRKDKKEGRKRRRKKKVKEEPGDPGSSSNGDSGEDSRSSSSSEEEAADSGSELSYEPPLRKKSLQSPGSVMEELVKLAQEQLDKGSLLESEGSGPSLVSGVKITTYFALLIRPFYAPGSPLLRELYSLAQSIDLLRGGKLAEAADSLASRFIAVHTAMSDGGWGTASQLEMFPLEQTQSASTATMLRAQKHRKLVLKSQGAWSGNKGWKGKGRGQWNYGGGQDDPGKGKGKHKGKKGGKNKQDNQKGDNPWKDNQWKEKTEENKK